MKHCEFRVPLLAITVLTSGCQATQSAFDTDCTVAGRVNRFRPTSTTTDGRVCRQVRPVVVDKSGNPHEETVSTYRNDWNQWVAAAR